MAGASSIDTCIDLNKLVTRHSIIMRTTGLEKSTTVAGILNTLTDINKFLSVRILILDILVEYTNTFKD